MNDLKFTRTFDAPRETVFKACTDPTQIAKWFGPRHFTTTVLEHNATPGGLSRIVMHGPDGKDYPGKAIFREVVRPERLSMSSYVVDAKGNEVMETLITATFEEKNNKTTLTSGISSVCSCRKSIDCIRNEAFGESCDKAPDEELGVARRGRWAGLEEGDHGARAAGWWIEAWKQVAFNESCVEDTVDDECCNQAADDRVQEFPLKVQYVDPSLSQVSNPKRPVQRSVQVSVCGHP